MSQRLVKKLLASSSLISDGDFNRQRTSLRSDRLGTETVFDRLLKKPAGGRIEKPIDEKDQVVLMTKKPGNVQGRLGKKITSFVVENSKEQSTREQLIHLQKQQQKQQQSKDPKKTTFVVENNQAVRRSSRTFVAELH